MKKIELIEQNIMSGNDCIVIFHPITSKYGLLDKVHKTWLIEPLCDKIFNQKFISAIEKDNTIHTYPFLVILIKGDTFIYDYSTRKILTPDITPKGKRIDYLMPCNNGIDYTKWGNYIKNTDGIRFFDNDDKTIWYTKINDLIKNEQDVFTTIEDFSSNISLVKSKITKLYGLYDKEQRSFAFPCIAKRIQLLNDIKELSYNSKYYTNCQIVCEEATAVFNYTSKTLITPFIFEHHKVTLIEPKYQMSYSVQRQKGYTQAQILIGYYLYYGSKGTRYLTYISTIGARKKFYLLDQCFYTCN